MNEEILIALCKAYKEMEICRKWAEQAEDKISYIQGDLNMLIERTLKLPESKYGLVEGDWDNVFDALEDLSVTPEESAKKILEIKNAAEEGIYLE